MFKIDDSFNPRYNCEATIKLRHAVNEQYGKGTRFYVSVVEDYRKILKKLGFNPNLAERRLGHLFEGKELFFAQEVKCVIEKLGINLDSIELRTNLVKRRKLQPIVIDQSLIRDAEINPKMDQFQGLGSTALKLRGFESTTEFVRFWYDYLRDINISCGYGDGVFESLVRHWCDCMGGYKLLMDKELYALQNLLDVPYSQSYALMSEESIKLSSKEISRINTRKGRFKEGPTPNFKGILDESNKQVTLQRVSATDKVQKIESSKVEKVSSEIDAEDIANCMQSVMSKVFGTVKTFFRIQ